MEEQGSTLTPGYLSGCLATYSCIEDDDAGTGNINNDPLFASGPSGTWTVAVSYDATTGESTLTCAGAGWTTGAFAGLLVNPDTSQSRQFVIKSNTGSTVTVWGDVTGIAAPGDAFQIYDYHLKSQGGRWTSSGWAHSRRT